MNTKINSFNKLCDQFARFGGANINIFKSDEESATFSIKLFTSSNLSQLVADEISRLKIVRFGKNFPGKDFTNKMSQYIMDALTKYSNPKAQIKRKEEEMELGSRLDERQKSEIATIINEYLNEESKQAMQRIENCRDRLANCDGSFITPEYDYRKVCPLDTLDNYQSELFHKGNYEIVMYYYLEYISRFPISLEEFEKRLFYFLTFHTDKKYPIGIEIIENLKFIDHINEILKMRFIDISDEVIMVVLNAISTVPVLAETSKLINDSIKRYKDFLYEQSQAMSS
jgi:hypothetical protein